MVTLVMIIWIAVLFLFMTEFYVLSSRELGMPVDIIILLVFIHGIISIPISLGIFFDLYDKFPLGQLTIDESIRFYLILGFITLGVFSISSYFFFQRIRQHQQKVNVIGTLQAKIQDDKYPSATFRRVMLVVELIGLVASILGIISFYLDYAK